MSAFSTIPKGQPFDSVLLADRLQDYDAPRDKITRMLGSGEIVRVRKGLYIPGAVTAQAEVDPLVLAALIYGPAYVSHEKALELHGLIPERVSEVTCATTKRHKIIDTPIGRFAYHPLPRAAFPLGVSSQETTGGRYWLATPEKALCDRVAQAPGIQNQSHIEKLLRELRIEPEALRRLDLQQVHEIAAAYRWRPVRHFARWLTRFQKKKPSST
jgi:predicted transcriptional regulator of viral defense system